MQSRDSILDEGIYFWNIARMSQTLTESSHNSLNSSDVDLESSWKGSSLFSDPNQILNSHLQDPDGQRRRSSMFSLVMAESQNLISPAMDVDVQNVFRKLSTTRCSAIIDPNRMFASPVPDVDLQNASKRRSTKISENANRRRSAANPVSRLDVNSRSSTDYYCYVGGQNTDVIASDEFKALTNTIKLTAFNARRLDL